jgi:Ser/Thr protein kinase RdoA (MazF antagonist)
MTTDWHSKRDRFDQRIVPSLIHKLWRGDPASLRWISQDYNIVFRFEVAGCGHYLRICHPALHPLPKARQVMGFLRFLAAEGVPVGQPAPSVNGAYIETLDGDYFAAAQREAPGVLMEEHLLDIAAYQAWGQSLGKLHAASRRYQPDRRIDYEFPTVEQFWRNIEATARAQSPAIQRAYTELTDWMHNLPRHDRGLIHGDYRPGNVVWDGTTARTIDFDEPNIHWYIADIGRALLELYDQPLADRRRFRKAFMRGYLGEHDIDDWWVTQLPYFAQHRAMLMYMWDIQEGGCWSEIERTALERVGW